MADKPSRKEDILAVAKAFRQVLTDNFAGDFPRVVETLQLATAMTIVDLKNDGKITDEGIKKFFIIYVPALQDVYNVLSNPPQEKKDVGIIRD
jgi:hypothetical protein